MSGDPFIAEIATILTTDGYQVVTCTEPKYRDYDNVLPTVFVSPIDDPEIKWLGFGKRNVIQTYQIVFAFVNQLDTIIADNNIWDFKSDVINMMSLPQTNTGLTALGVWKLRAESVDDYEKYNLRQGYTYSIMKIKLSYIQNN